jgi:hypothetical protein
MKKYRVINILRLFSGLIELDEDQATHRRKHLMADILGVYKICKPIEFKVGEIVGLDSVDKAISLCVEPIEEPIEEFEKPVEKIEKKTRRVKK